MKLEEFVAKYAPGLAELSGFGRLVQIAVEPLRARENARSLIKEIRRPVPKKYTPALLLQAARSPVGFGYRDKEQEEFLTWAADPLCEMPKWYLMTGGPGRGKTRFMMEIVRELNSDQSHPWTSGFLDLERIRNNPEFLLQFQAITDDILLVIDYAERFEKEVVLVMQASLWLAEADPSRRVRVVFISRREADIWSKIANRTEDIRDYVGADGLMGAELPELGRIQEDRQTVFDAAVEDFAQSLGKHPKSSDIDLGPKEYREVLMIHVAALLHVMEDGLPKDIKPNMLLERLLDREKRHWDEMITERGLPDALKGAPIRQAAEYLTLVTVGDRGIATREEAIASLSACPLLHGQSAATIGAVAELFHDLYPGAGWVNGVTPDRLGSYCLAFTDDTFIEELYAGIDG